MLPNNLHGLLCCSYAWTHLCHRVCLNWRVAYICHWGHLFFFFWSCAFGGGYIPLYLLTGQVELPWAIQVFVVVSLVCQTLLFPFVCWLCNSTFVTFFFFFLLQFWNYLDNSLLVRVPDSLSKGCEFESRQERRENVLCADCYSVSVPPPITFIRCLFQLPCYRSGT